MCLQQVKDPPLPLRKVKPIPAGMGIGSPPHTSHSSPLNRAARRPGVNKTNKTKTNGIMSKKLIPPE